MELGRVEITTTINGEQVQVELDLSPDEMTIQESVRVEEQLGQAKAEALFSGQEIVVLPSVLRTMVWAKLVTIYPSLPIDGWDMKFADVGTALDDQGDLVELTQAETEKALFVDDVDLDQVRQGAAGKA